MRDNGLILRRWLPIAASVTALCLLVYATVQQALRSGANDPQIQLAEDAARALERGATPESVVPANSVSIAESLAPFVIVYDSTFQPLAGRSLREVEERERSTLNMVAVVLLGTLAGTFGLIWLGERSSR